MNNEQILEKIRKLLTLSENASATTSEAETASSLAQTLIFKYNLSMEDVKDSKLKTDYIRSVYDLKCKSYERNWSISLMVSISIYNRCKVFTYPNRKTVLFIGKRFDIDNVLYLYHFLQASISRASSMAYRFSYSTDDRVPWLYSFCIAACVRVEMKFDARKQKFINDNKSNPNALMIFNNNALMKASNDLVPNSRKARKQKKKFINMKGYQLGDEFGEQIQVDKSLGSS